MQPIALLAAGFGLAFASPQPADLPPEVLLLARAKAQVREQIAHLPDCTCLETIERYRKPAKAPTAKAIDQVRLEVLFSGETELYASPGDTEWSSNVTSFVGGGMIGTGIFALTLRGILLGNANLTYRGETVLAGRRAATFEFHEGLFRSGYSISYNGVSGNVAKRGFVWIDAGTLDPIRLEMHADEIPPYLPYEDVATIIDYARMPVGDRQVLLPQAAELTTRTNSGEENRDQIAFTHCHAFQTESSVSFTPAGTKAPPAAPATSTAARIRAPSLHPLPPGLNVVVTLAEALDDTSAVGARVSGWVVGDVAANGVIVVPKGALVVGRVRRMERSIDERAYFIVALEFTEIELPEARLGFFATLKSVDGAGARMKLVYDSDTDATHLHLRVEETDTIPNLPVVGSFFVEGAHLHLPVGFRTTWKTLDPVRPEAKR